MDGQEATGEARARTRLQNVTSDKAGYVSAIVERWGSAARDSGLWGSNYQTELSATLMKLRPESLVLASEASSFEEMMEIVATGERFHAILQQSPSLLKDLKATPPIVRALTLDAKSPVAVLGSTSGDFVFTPLTPCRIVDSRLAFGVLQGFGFPRVYDVDGASFSGQGGVSGGCGIPSNVARAVAMNLTITQPSTTGWASAWALGSWTGSSSINFIPGAGIDIANTTIVPVVPGPGSDFTVMSNVPTHLVIDVVGYFAPPVATAVECTSVESAPVACAYNTWTSVDAFCPAGYTATGGGYNTTEGSLGYPGVWLTSVPLINGWRTWVDNQNSNGPRNITTWVRCCRIPGR